MEIPEWQVQEYNPNFFILRQSPCTDYEKPFVFLFFGKEKAMLIDTGSRNGNMVPSLKWVVKNWLKRNGRDEYSSAGGAYTSRMATTLPATKTLQAMNDPAMPVTFRAANVDSRQR